MKKVKKEVKDPNVLSCSRCTNEPAYILGKRQPMCLSCIDSELDYLESELSCLQSSGI